jgi:Xaa-Pro aminopeptidase
VYDHRRLNPVFYDLAGDVGHVTRPCFLWIPASGPVRAVAHAVEAARFAALGPVAVYSGRAERLKALADLLRGATRVAMEYSSQAALPLASRVDGGTLELVRGLGVEVVSSADLVAYATARWSPEQADSHRSAARKLTETVRAAFAEVAQRLSSGVTEFDIAEFIRGLLAKEGLDVPDGPIVAANAHASDPHYEPPAHGSSPLRRGDWLLIDLWAREKGEAAVYADITWTAYIGVDVPERMQRVFDLVLGARDAAVAALENAYREGRSLQGWEVDQVARDYIERAGYGAFFTHRLGHSIGREVHGNGPNLDGFETLDTRLLVAGMGFSVEPGIYLPDFGVRSEIDVFLGPRGLEVTTEPQREIVRILGPV